MRLIDVQSDSTALKVSKNVVKEIRSLAGIQDVAPAMTMSGVLSVADSRMDAVVVATTNSYLTYADYDIIEGRNFSPSAEAEYLGKTNDVTDLQKLIAGRISARAEVAGAQSKLPQIERGEETVGADIHFRVKDYVYLPIRRSPIMGSEIFGYVQGSVLSPLTGREVWGDEFTTAGTEGRAIYANEGRWYGKWIRAEFPLYQEDAPTVYSPVKDENGKQKMTEGYIPERDVQVLTQEAYEVEKDLTSDEADVLGESTTASESARSTNLLKISADEKNATDVAALAKIIESQQTKTKKPVANSSVITGLIEVKKREGKEIIVSTGLLQTMKKNPRQIVGTTLNLEYIVSGGLIPGMDGRVLSKKIPYTVVGVVQDANKSLVFTPIADTASMGIDTYSNLKVLAKSPDTLNTVRSRIETLGFSTHSIVDTVVQVNKLFMVMRYLFASFGIIAFIVAIIGMFNTLTITLLERTREVAVMKTLGTTNHDISRLFLVESLLIGLVGGIAGIILGLVLGVSVDMLLMMLRGDGGIRLFVFPPFFLLLMLGVSVVVGLVTGLYPAKRSRDISPLDAIRYE
jgi:ABC-type antimicrobial peptide transport system permease subunit